MAQRRDHGDAFLFEYERWRSSRPVQRMSFSARGVFLEMMIEQWMKKTLPDDVEAIIQALALSPDQEQEIRIAWPVVRTKFVTVEKQINRIQNVKLEKVRRARQAWDRSRQLAGQAGGRASAAKRREQRELKGKHTLSGATAHVNDSATISTESLCVESLGVVSKREEKSGVHRAHQFCGQRFCVPQFLHAEFEKQLGDRGLSRFDPFEWYGKLDGRDTFPIPGDVLAWIRSEWKTETSRLFVPPAEARRFR